MLHNPPPTPNDFHNLNGPGPVPPTHHKNSSSHSWPRPKGLVFSASVQLKETKIIPSRSFIHTGYMVNFSRKNSPKSCRQINLWSPNSSLCFLNFLITAPITAIVTVQGSPSSSKRTPKKPLRELRGMKRVGFGQCLHRQYLSKFYGGHEHSSPTPKRLH